MQTTSAAPLLGSSISSVESFHCNDLSKYNQNTRTRARARQKSKGSNSDFQALKGSEWATLQILPTCAPFPWIRRLPLEDKHVHIHSNCCRSVSVIITVGMRKVNPEKEVMFDLPAERSCQSRHFTLLLCNPSKKTEFNLQKYTWTC